jgi:hypothetical protein
VPESTVGASHIEGDLAETNDASSRVPFVEKTEDSGGLGYDADTVLALRYGVHGDYERASSTSAPARNPPVPCPSEL